MTFGSSYPAALYSALVSAAATVAVPFARDRMEDRICFGWNALREAEHAQSEYGTL